MLLPSYKKIYSPPIKCQGKKHKILPSILGAIQWDGDGIWIEPFIASGSVGFNVAPKSAIFSDNNPHIVQFYKDIQSGELTYKMVRSYLEEHGEKLSNNGDYYYEVRSRFNSSPSSLDFLFLNRCGYNGLIRFNGKGEYNVPFGKKPDKFTASSGSLITKITNQVEWLQDLILSHDEWRFGCHDWKHVLQLVWDSDFIYLDPPYIGKSTQYHKDWGIKDALELAEVVQKQPCGWALSMWVESHGNRNPHIDDWHGDLIEINHTYHVGPNKETRPKVVEGLIIKTNFCNLEQRIVA